MAEMITIARPYAKAAFKAGMDAGTVETWRPQIALLALIAQHKNVQELLHNPNVAPNTRADLFLQVAGGQLDKQLANLVQVMAQNDRLALLPELHQLYERYAADWAKRIEVEVISARPLDDTHKDRIKEALSKRLERDIEMQIKVDDTLLGGALIKAGDLVIDGSALGKLAKLKESLYG